MYKLIVQGRSVGKGERRRVFRKEIAKVRTRVAGVLQELQEVDPPPCVPRAYVEDVPSSLLDTAFGAIASFFRKETAPIFARGGAVSDGARRPRGQGVPEPECAHEAASASQG
jgi:hypothetical protein